MTQAKPPASKPLTQPKKLSKLAAFMATPGAKLANGVVALGLACVFGSWAIDSGSLMDYAITALLLLAGVRELVDGARSWRRN